jgi:hypothetical protein
VDLRFDRLRLRDGVQGTGMHAEQGKERPAAVVGQKNAKSESGKYCTGKA